MHFVSPEWRRKMFENINFLAFSFGIDNPSHNFGTCFYSLLVLFWDREAQPLGKMTSFAEGRRISEETSDSSDGSIHKQAPILLSHWQTEAHHFLFTCTAISLFKAAVVAPLPSLLCSLVLKLKSPAQEHCGVSAGTDGFPRYGCVST